MTIQNIDTLIKERLEAVIAELARIQKDDDKRSNSFQMAVPLTRAEKRAARTAKAKERLLRIHKLAQWAVEHGGEEELFGKK